MKFACLLFVSVLVSLKTWGGGGVDVGNHSPVGFLGSFEISGFESEENMVAHIQKLLPEIEDAKHSEVLQLISIGHCSKKGVRFEALEPVEAFDYNQKNGRLNKSMSGIVTVNLKECKKPSRLPFFDHN